MGGERDYNSKLVEKIAPYQWKKVQFLILYFIFNGRFRGLTENQLTCQSPTTSPLIHDMRQVIQQWWFSALRRRRDRKGSGFRQSWRAGRSPQKCAGLQPDNCLPLETDSTIVTPYQGKARQNILSGVSNAKLSRNKIITLLDSTVQTSNTEDSERDDCYIWDGLIQT